MKIDHATIGMESARSYTSTLKKEVSVLSVSVSTASLLENSTSANSLRNILRGEAEDKTQNFKQSLLDIRNKFSQVSGLTSTNKREEADKYQKLREQCINFLLKLLFENKSKKNQTTLADLREENGTVDFSGVWNESTSLSGSMGNTLSQMNSLIGSSNMVSMVHENYTYSEKEDTSFSATGKVVTSDGREINFNLSMEMSRSFKQYYEQNYEMTSANLCDPLVINMGTDMATLNDQKFLFDIDADGILDNISGLNSKSGYLALDKNGDNVINNGSELFGTSSGNGFADLMKEDSDHNGWIDENDDIWNKLLIWSKDEKGQDCLYHLSEKGIGAICLENVSTDFSLKSRLDNQTNGMIRNTGIFLYENGNTGTVQHLDVAR